MKRLFTHFLFAVGMAIFLLPYECARVMADTPPPGTVKAKLFSGDGATSIGATAGALDVHVTNSSSSTVDQGHTGVESWLASITSSALPTNACQETGGHLASIDTKLSSPLAVTGTFWQATQPVSGTVTANAGTGTFTVDASGHTVPVSGTFWQATQPVSGTFWQATQPVSLASLPALATGSNTIGNVNINGTVPISGSITATNSANGDTGAAVPAQATQVAGSDGTNLVALKVSSAGVVSVDGSGTTQPVSGTFWQATQPVSGTFWQTTQPVSAASLPLPSGASTETTLSTLNGKVPSNLTVSSTRLLVDGSGVTQPVSGTVTSNIGTTGGLALDSSVTGLQVAQGSTTSGQAGGLTLGAVTTAAPSYTTAKTSPLSLTTTGALRTDSSATTQPVSGTFWQATQPVSGTFWQATQPVSGTFWQATQPVSGTVTATNASIGATGATTPVSATLAGMDDSGTMVALESNGGGELAVADQSLTGILAAMEVTPSAAGAAAGITSYGYTTTAAPSYTTAQTNPLSLTTAGALRTDSSATTQPVSGTFWQATQPVSGTFWQATQPVSGTFWQATQPVSGTVTANIGTSGSLALDATVSGLHVAQNSTTSGQTGGLVQGAVTTAAPSYTTAKTSPLSLTTTGALRVDGSAVTQPVSGTFWQATQPVSGTFWQATQPVSGTVTANIGTSGSLALDASVTGLQVSQGSTTSGEKGGLTLGAVTTAAPSYTTAQTSPLSLTTVGNLRVDGSSVTQPVSGTFWQATQPVSGTFWQATQPVSGTVTANIGTSGSLALDATVSGLHVAQASTTSGQTGALIQGAVTTAAPSYTTAKTSPLSLTTVGNLRVDGSSVTQPVSGTFWQATQPVSGTVTANAGTGNFTVTQATGTNLHTVVDSAPTTAVTQSGTWTVQPGNTANTTAWLVSSQAKTPTAVTVKQAALTIGTTAARLTNDGLAPASTRVLLIAQLLSTSTANCYLGSSTVTTTSTTRGVQMFAGQSYAFNNDAGDYYAICDASSQTFLVTEQE